MLTINDIIESREEAVELNDKIITELQEEIKINTIKVYERIIKDLIGEAISKLNESVITLKYQLYKTNFVADGWGELASIFKIKTPDYFCDTVLNILNNLETRKRNNKTLEEIRALYHNYSYMNGLFLIAFYKEAEDEEVGHEEDKVEYMLVSLKELLNYFKEGQIDVEYTPDGLESEEIAYDLTVKAAIPTKEEIHTKTLKQNHEHLD